MLGTHLSRWAEDLILYSSKEFGFVALADAYRSVGLYFFTDIQFVRTKSPLLISFNRVFTVLLTGYSPPSHFIVIGQNNTCILSLY